ncbi:MAG: hypothetical protein IPK60_20540 [Sandaracinaceae bacterium]|nr:hypothetical protein [Sandaracinaceae bacterium]
MVDEVKYVYDGWGNLTDFRQDKDSAVGGSGYWAVQYSYVKATGGRNTLRRDSITTPGGTYNYSYRTSAGFDGDASRVSQISDDFDTALVTYQYNGAGSVGKTTLEEPESFPKLFTGTGTTFSGLDRFNRTIVSKWTKDLATDRDIYKVTVGYDENSNITSQDDAAFWPRRQVPERQLESPLRRRRRHAGEWFDHRPHAPSNLDAESHRQLGTRSSRPGRRRQLQRDGTNSTMTGRTTRSTQLLRAISTTTRRMTTCSGTTPLAT